MRLGKLSVYAGAPIAFYLYSKYHQPIYEFLLGESFLAERNLDLLTWYEEGPTQ